jgi:hypothetical protein
MDDAMIQFITVFTDGDFDKAAAIDDASLYVVDRKSRAPLIGYDYFLRAVPLTSVDYVDIVRESRGQRIRRGLLGFVVSLALCAFLIAAYRAGRIVIGAVVIIAPLGVLLALPFCFQGLNTTLTFMVGGRKHAVELASRRWQSDGLQIVEYLAATGIRCCFYGFPSRQSTAEE